MLTTPSFKYVAILALLMASAVTLANILVQFVINDWLTWGAFTYPIVFVITDCTTRLFGGNIARKIMYVGVVVGIVFSLFFAPVQIAIASATAFIMGQLLDISVFSYLLKRCSAQLWWIPPSVSSFFGASIDTIFFFSIAFWGTQHPWLSLAIGDFAVKVVMVALFLPVYKFIVSAFIVQQARISTT